MNLSRAARLYPWENLVTKEAEVQDIYAEERQQLEQDFHAFAVAAWPHVVGRPRKIEWYHHAYHAHLQALEPELKWLMVHLPARTGKTIDGSVLYPAWRWARQASLPMLSSSFSPSRCTDDAGLMRSLVSTPWFQRLWPIRFAPDQNTKERYKNTANGQRITVLYGAGGTGDGGQLLTLDDAQSARDQSLPMELERDEAWFHDTWLQRRNEKVGDDQAQLLFIAHRLGWRDLPNAARLAYPDRWHVLALEARKTSVLISRYWSKQPDGTYIPTDLLRCKTALFDDGRCADPRLEGEILTERLPDSELDSQKPSVFKAQSQQAPERATLEGARVHVFDRDVHMAMTFAERMQCLTVREAIAKAIRQGWYITTGWDHGLDAHREWCVIFAVNDNIRQWWAIAVYRNPSRAGTLQDAMAVRDKLDEMGIHPTQVIRSKGDVGTIKASSSPTPQTVNRDLENCVYPKGHPRAGQKVLGFRISPPKKEPGCVEAATEAVNETLSRGQGYLDPACLPLAESWEQWVGLEAFKDGCDAAGYKIRDISDHWRMLDSGGSGSAEM